MFAVNSGLKTAVTFGKASVVLLIANLSFVLTVVLAIFLGKENFSFPKVLAIVFAIGSIICLSSN